MSSIQSLKMLLSAEEKRKKNRHQSHQYNNMLLLVEHKNSHLNDFSRNFNKFCIVIHCHASFFLFLI